jgi:hypothetical protein
METTDPRVVAARCIVDATSYEAMTLWERHQQCHPAVKWEHDCRGFMAQLGEFGGMPVNVSVSFAKINGHTVMFWEFVSMVTDARLWDAFIAKYNPKAYTTNAMNFNNCYPEIGL